MNEGLHYFFISGRSGGGNNFSFWAKPKSQLIRVGFLNERMVSNSYRENLLLEDWYRQGYKTKKY
jgi:hypothetical protein